MVLGSILFRGQVNTGAKAVAILDISGIAFSRLKPI
jgi:hypothetical protein